MLKYIHNESVMWRKENITERLNYFRFVCIRGLAIFCDELVEI